MTSQNIERGALVKSLAGHDKGEAFVIMEVVDGNYVLIANGTTRKISSLKRKKTKHVKILNANIDLDALGANGGLNDGLLSKAIGVNLNKIGG